MVNSSKPREECSWLLLRGLTRGSGHWGDFPEILKKDLSLSDVFFIDLPGNGNAFNSKSPWLIQKYIDSIRQQALQKKKFPKLNVVAISMGGMIAVDWMRRFPNEINQAFLINTSAANFSFPLKRFQIQSFIKNLFIENLTREELKKQEYIEKRILSVSSNNEQRSQEFLSQLADYSEAHPVSLKNTFRQLVAAMCFSFPPMSPGNIVLFASQKDRLVSAECSKRIAKVWQVPIDVNLSAGHDLPLDDPHWLTLKIKNRSLLSS
jgi:pimeloyl-ACP methyl ester carboxylesterase